MQYFNISAHSTIKLIFFFYDVRNKVKGEGGCNSIANFVGNVKKFSDILKEHPLKDF